MDRIQQSLPRARAVYENNTSIRPKAYGGNFGWTLFEKLRELNGVSREQ